MLAIIETFWKFSSQKRMSNTKYLKMKNADFACYRFSVINIANVASIIICRTPDNHL